MKRGFELRKVLEGGNSMRECILVTSGTKGLLRLK